MIFLELILFIFLLIASAFFSGAETAFFSLKTSQLKKTDKEERILQLLNHPRKLLITILTGNTLVNILMAFFAAILTADMAQRMGMNLPVLLAIESVVLTMIILLSSEITPKILAIKNSEKFAHYASLPVKIASFLLYPIVTFFYYLTHLLTQLIPIKKEALFDSEVELRTLADLGAEKGSLNEKERHMIQSVFDYGETSVREIMVPRTDVIGIEQTHSIEDAIQVIRKTRYSKFPVYNDNLDNITGILYAKDLLPYLDKQKPKTSLIKLCRKPYFIPESKPIDDLLRDFQRRRENIAIVVDEYGGTAGLVTVEDVVEEVVGEIRDEFDRESSLIIKIGKRKWLVDAKIPINDLIDRIPLTFPEDREYDTLGGFLLEQFGDIPSLGNTVDYGNYQFEVRSILGHRIIKVIITKEEENSETK